VSGHPQARVSHAPGAVIAPQNHGIPLWTVKCLTNSTLLRITAVTFILICTSAAWFILGSTIDHHTG
jgi:hypothetical protein